MPHFTGLSSFFFSPRAVVLTSLLTEFVREPHIMTSCFPALAHGFASPFPFRHLFTTLCPLWPGTRTPSGTARLPEGAGHRPGCPFPLRSSQCSSSSHWGLFFRDFLMLLWPLFLLWWFPFLGWLPLFLCWVFRLGQHFFSVILCHGFQPSNGGYETSENRYT